MSEKITYDAKETAALIGISPSKMYQLIRENKVPHITFGRRTVIPKSSFLAWVEHSTGGDNICAEE